MLKPCKASDSNNFRDGYPEKRIAGKTVRLHRAALEQKLGRRIRPGLYALHTCGNRWCIEPDHLYEGTHQQNMEDMKSSGRSANCGSPRKLSDDQVREVRTRLAAGEAGSLLAKEFGVNKAQVSRIKNGTSYRWVE